MKADSPVCRKEDDLLDRFTFAEQLVKGLLTNFENRQDSIVIGLNGEWGSGKSSLLAFIESEIKNQTSKEPFRNYFFSFNPWRILNQDDLQIQFLKGLGEILGNYSIANEQLKEDFKKFGSVAGDANKVNFEPLSKSVIGTIAALIKGFTKESSLLDLKKEVDERLADNNIKFFILIDDVDRLQPKEIVEIFQLIKLNANFKNTYFIVAFDKNVVINALTKEFGLDGEKYLEKIVQIDYTIPAIATEDISKFFASEVNKIITSVHYKLNIVL